jgi:putative MATE family efflux protein
LRKPSGIPVDLSVWKRVLNIALPLMLAESMDSILWMTDTYFVSKLGDTAVEAVGLGGYISWMTFSIASIFYMGTLIIVSQAYGAKEYSKAERALREAIFMSIVTGISVTLSFWIVSYHIINIIAGANISHTAKVQAETYFKARLLGITFAYVGETISSAYRGTGKTTPILWSSLAYTITNLILDPILIFGFYKVPSYGIMGAGIASTIANLTFMMVNVSLLKRTININPGISLPSNMSKIIISLGIPTFLERITLVSGHLFYLGVIARCGDASLAAHTIGIRIESLAFLPLFSIGEATAAVVGQDVGSGNIDKAKKDA